MKFSGPTGVENGHAYATNTRSDAGNQRQGRHDPSPQWISDAIHARIRSDMMGCEDGCSVGDAGDGAPDKKEWFETIGADVRDETVRMMSSRFTDILRHSRYVGIDLGWIDGPTLSQPTDEKDGQGEKPSACTN